MNSKKCIKCNILKNYSFYHKTNRNKTGCKNTCKECIKIYDRKYRKLNSEKIKERSKKYYLNNKKESYLKSIKYYKNNKEKICKKIKLKKKTDFLYKLKCSLRCRTTSAFKSSKWTKNNTIKDILGSDYKIIKNYLSNKFTKGMSWDNHGEWHIDHIIPLSSAKTKQQLIELCHYTNLQPLWAKDNLKKGSKHLKQNS